MGIHPKRLIDREKKEIHRETGPKRNIDQKIRVIDVNKRPQKNIITLKKYSLRETKKMMSTLLGGITIAKAEKFEPSKIVGVNRYFVTHQLGSTAQGLSGLWLIWDYMPPSAKDTFKAVKELSDEINNLMKSFYDDKLNFVDLTIKMKGKLSEMQEQVSELSNKQISGPLADYPSKIQKRISEGETFLKAYAEFTPIEYMIYASKRMEGLDKTMIMDAVKMFLSLDNNQQTDTLHKILSRKTEIENAGGTHEFKEAWEAFLDGIKPKRSGPEPAHHQE